MKKLLYVLLVLIILAGFILVLKNQSNKEDVGLANPASVFCVDNGGQLDIRTDAEGAQTGFCIFEDNTECEEWAFSRGDCQSGTSAASSVGIPIRLYYYNEALDQGPGGAQCSSKGLVAVDRTIQATTLPLTKAVRLLLQGDILPAEKTEGLTTEFPLAGLSLVNAEIEDGVATLTFDDPQNKTGGGACRTGILWAQIEATAKQFPSVKSVRFLPEELFQP